MHQQHYAAKKWYTAYDNSFHSKRFWVSIFAFLFSQRIFTVFFYLFDFFSCFLFLFCFFLIKKILCSSIGFKSEIMTPDGNILFARMINCFHFIYQLLTNAVFQFLILILSSSLTGMDAGPENISETFSRSSAVTR